jgi:hypothetical protein
MTRPRTFYGKGIPGIDTGDLKGKLIVLEGPDGSGRSTQTGFLTEWLERRGHAVEHVGLKRSTLVAEELAEAKHGNVLSPRTLSLFYATDFADQLEHRIIPALRAGFVVLADRYIYTLMARDMVRGADLPWLQSVYSSPSYPTWCCTSGWLPRSSWSGTSTAVGSSTTGSRGWTSGTTVPGTTRSSVTSPSFTGPSQSCRRFMDSRPSTG